jgi:hypothetical protein
MIILGTSRPRLEPLINRGNPWPSPIYQVNVKSGKPPHQRTSSMCTAHISQFLITFEVAMICYWYELAEILTLCHRWERKLNDCLFRKVYRLWGCEPEIHNQAFIPGEHLKVITDFKRDHPCESLRVLCISVMVMVFMSTFHKHRLWNAISDSRFWHLLI